MIESIVYTVEGTLTVEYTYNYLGDRITKTVDGVTTYYTLDYSSGLSQVIEKTTNSKTVLYVRGLELISREETSGTYFYILDGGNTVRALVDEEGNVTDRYVFDSVGNEISREGDSKNSYGFQGEQLDEETGLYYLRARYMSPSTGTFTSMDTYGGTLSDPASLHKYLFANSNPVKYCDPTGCFSLVEFQIGVAISTILTTVETGLLYYIENKPNEQCNANEKRIFDGNMICLTCETLLKGFLGAILIGVFEAIAVELFFLYPLLLVHVLFSLNADIEQINDANEKINDNDPSNDRLGRFEMAFGIINAVIDIKDIFNYSIDMSCKYFNANGTSESVIPYIPDTSTPSSPSPMPPDSPNPPNPPAASGSIPLMRDSGCGIIPLYPPIYLEDSGIAV